MPSWKLMIASAAALGVTACESMAPSERNAAIGAGLGGVAGYALGEDAGSAALGAVVGGAAGWYLGCRQEGRCGAVDNRQTYYDQRTGRNYFYDRQSGRYFYENGEPYRG
jgi:membrane protein YqaA with SNARE-associated domain